MNKPVARRRSPIVAVLLLLAALTFTGTAYAVMKPAPPADQAVWSGASTSSAEEGHRLFLANCATCHGKNGQGTNVAPSLAGVGEAAVLFQVGTGRMPLAAPAVQAPKRDPLLNEQQTADLAAFVATLGPGPGAPEAKYLDLQGADIAQGGAIFRTNCAMCHNSAGAGGALSRGKYAPSLMGVTPEHIYEAMLTGPQSMPVFNDANITPQEKEDVIAFLKNIEDGGNSYGGQALGSMGPAGDAVFVWTIGIGLLIAAAVWLGRKAA